MSKTSSKHKQLARTKQKTNTYIVRAQPILRSVWRWVRAHVRLLLLAAITFVILMLLPVIVVFVATWPGRYDGNSKVSLADVPRHDIAIVFGAGVLPDGTPTPYLKERISTAVALYKAGKVNSLLMTGDNSTSHYNEPVHMRDYAIHLGMDPSSIVLDYAGYSTYDSCWRARHIFGVASAVVVTQAYHVPRALATCRSFGMDAVGVSAQHMARDFTLAYLIREVVATDKAVFQMVRKPLPTIAK